MGLMPIKPAEVLLSYTGANKAVLMFRILCSLIPQVVDYSLEEL